MVFIHLKVIKHHYDKKKENSHYPVRKEALAEGWSYKKEKFSRLLEIAAGKSSGWIYQHTSVALEATMMLGCVT